MDQLIASTFEEFFTIVAKKIGVDREKVRNICARQQPIKIPAKRETKADKEKAKLVTEALRYISDEIHLSKLTNDKLKEQCRAKGLKVTGKKDDLISRLQNPTLAENKTTGKKKKKSVFKAQDVSKILQTLRGPVAHLAVRKNDHGVFVHVETQLVFDQSTQKVIGRWKDDQVKWLTKPDVEMCVQLGVLYELPENLNHGQTKVTDHHLLEVLGEDDFKEEVLDDEDEEGSDADA